MQYQAVECVLVSFLTRAEVSQGFQPLFEVASYSTNPHEGQTHHTRACFHMPFWFYRHCVRSCAKAMLMNGKDAVSSCLSTDYGLSWSGFPLLKWRELEGEVSKLANL